MLSTVVVTSAGTLTKLVEVAVTLTISVSPDPFMFIGLTNIVMFWVTVKY